MDAKWNRQSVKCDLRSDLGVPCACRYIPTVGHAVIKIVLDRVNEQHELNADSVFSATAGNMIFRNMKKGSS